MLLSKKASEICESVTLSITAKAKEMKKQGIDVIGFGAGEPDFNTPDNIQKAAIKAIEMGYTKYTPASGIDDLKEAIVTKFKKDNNLSYKKSQIIISTGAKQSLYNSFLAILNPGDEVLVGKPYWVSYPELIKLSGGIPVFVDTDESNAYKYTIKELNKHVSNKTKAIVINSPNNPTGTVYTKEELMDIANFAKEHDLIIISDEIYEKLIYDGNKHISIASLSEDAYMRTIVINGVSKSYSMTGWRIGYAAADEKITKLMTNIQSHTTSNPNSIAQYAALEALNGDQEFIFSMIKEFENRRNYMVDKINSIPDVYCICPKGAFYIMINIENTFGKKINGEDITNSVEFCEKLLKYNNVAAIPGMSFGVEGFIRVSYATSMENIKKGLDNMEKFIISLIQ